MNKVWVVLAIFFVVTGCVKDYKGANNKNGSDASYQWLTGKLSVEKKFGDAWEGGCKGTLCDEKTECHAKGDYGSSPLWLPTDTKIRVPAVDAKSNAWITNWGTIIKK